MRAVVVKGRIVTARPFVPFRVIGRSFVPLRVIASPFVSLRVIASPPKAGVAISQKYNNEIASPSLRSGSQ
jgi:hypothetical protein